MSEGLATTFGVLGKTANEAAVRVLLAALDSPHTSVQEGALAALLKRRSTAGGREILRRLPTISERWKEIIRRNESRLSRSLRDAILEEDRQMAHNACRAAVWFREYDLMPTLLNVLEDSKHVHATLAADTLMELAEMLSDEVTTPQPDGRRRDPQLVRSHVIASLEGSVRRFGHHRRREVLTAFFLLAGHNNAELKNILQDPHHVAFLASLEVLGACNHSGVIRLLVDFLDDPQVPSAVLGVIFKRSDVQFVRHVLHKVGREPSRAVAENLRRVETVAWIRLGKPFFDHLSDSEQMAVVRLVTATRAPRLQVFSLVEFLLKHGKPGGRREAARALADFNGADANAVALKALDDPDAEVQANIIGHLRPRGIPGVLQRLVDMIDSPHAIVRQAVRACLSEFSFSRFAAAFDMLDEEVRLSTGKLVKKIDPQTFPLLKEELRSQIRSRRLRGLEIARTLDTVEQVEELVIGLLQDDDHIVRAEAAAALAQCGTTNSQRALQRALHDRSTAVRDAVEQSLSQREQFLHWREALADPRD